MLVAIDFDGVISEAPAGWLDIVSKFDSFGWDVCVVTQNYPGERDDIDEWAKEANVPVFFTMSHKKDEYMKSKIGKVPDIIIDDNAGAWVSDSWA